MGPLISAGHRDKVAHREGACRGRDGSTAASRMPMADSSYSRR